MLRYVTPHVRLRRAVDLDAGRLLGLGIGGLLLDVDCTLKDYHATGFAPEIVEWSRSLSRDGLRLCLLSNGHPGRVGRLAGALDLPYVARAFKPFPFGCHSGIATLGLPRDRVAVMGDQLFADILAGRLAGLFTILVHPTSPAEPWFTRLKRPVERRLLARLPEPSHVSEEVLR